MHVCFFFQAEAGIRGATVTGVQTCALPICGTWTKPAGASMVEVLVIGSGGGGGGGGTAPPGLQSGGAGRSEERRVGKGGRATGWADRREKAVRGGSKDGMDVTEARDIGDRW